MSMTRRSLLHSAAAASVAMPLSSGLPAAAAGEIAVLSYGGPIAKVENDLVVPFLQKNGIAASVTQATVIAPAVASQGSHPKYDLFTENILEIPQYPQIWQPIDEKDVPNAAHVYPSLMKAGQHKCIPAWVHSFCIAYNEKEIPHSPSLDDFTNPKYKGKIALQGSPLTLTFAPLILAGTGGTVQNPEPMFRWFEKVIPNILTDYTQVTQPAQMFQSGDVWLCLWYSGRAAQLRYTANVPVTWAKSPQVATLIGMAVTSGAANPAAAKAYINRWLDPEVQAAMATTASFGPVTSNAAVSKEAGSKLPVFGREEIERLIQPDWAAIAPHYNEWQARYDALVQKYGRR